MKKIILILTLIFLAGTGLAHGPKTQVPFTYYIDYTPDQSILPAFRENFETEVPTLFHPGSDLRYFGRFGFGATVLESRFTPYETYEQQTRDYLKFLHGKGVRWVTPYLCNQTISGNPDERFGPWEVVEHWKKYAPNKKWQQPGDPMNWLQREPSGNLHYNYKRRCFLERHQDSLQIRFAPCPNNSEWRDWMNNEARLAAKIGFDGFFIDNNIIHCYCPACETRFQKYLRQKYTPDQLQQAFGTRDFSQTTLYKEGDFRYWARTFPEFIPWLEAKYPPEERRIHFDTTGLLTEINVDAAGGGMLFGLCHEFLVTHVLPPDVPGTFENVRLANPALQTPQGRLRWAETVMFWGSSIGEQLAEMTAAGREVNPEFFLIPNWGIRQRINGAAGRAEDGKDMRRWATGATWQMYEEEPAIGQVAPGVILDFDMQLRYAFACGVRAMLLPYTLDDPAIQEIHLAEAAASGSSVFVSKVAALPVRAQYRKFFETHENLFRGFHSAARVALAHFFDQVHFINIEHLHQVHALNRFLADQQIPFDHIPETDFTPERLRDYDVILLPNIEFMSDTEVAAAQSFIENGGTLILIGKNAIYRCDCQPRPQPVDFSKKNPERVAHFASLELALPYRGIYLEKGLEALREQIFSLDFDSEIAKYVTLKKLDHKIGFKRYLTQGPLTAVISKALGIDPHLLDPAAASGVRHTFWEKTDAGGTRQVVYLANKNVPLAEAGRHVLQPKLNLKLQIPANHRRAPERASFHQPGAATQMLAVEFNAGKFEITLPELRAFGVVEIILE